MEDEEKLNITGRAYRPQYGGPGGPTSPPHRSPLIIAASGMLLVDMHASPKSNRQIGTN